MLFTNHQVKALMKPKYIVLANIILLLSSVVIYNAANQTAVDFQDFMQRSTSLGYAVEEHFVETEDGFILSVHRILGKEDQLNDIVPKKPILMGHGLGGSSDTFIRNTEELSLAYVLANEGYDVFIMNSRGNAYSNRHRTLNRGDPSYWDFSFEEMARFDLPAVAKWVYEIVYARSTKISYIGHSQGCTLALAALSEGYVSSEYFEKVVLITPASIQKNVDAPLQNLIKNVDFLPVLRDFGMNEFLRMNTLNYFACKLVPKICQFSLTLVTDTQQSPINHDIFYKLMLHYPAGTSTKAYIHFNQINQSKRFQHFDYGVEENLAKYQSAQAPEFNLANIVNQVHIIAGDQDKATPISDILHLQSALVNAQNVTLKVYSEGHCSFILGTNNQYQRHLLDILAAV